MPKNQPPKYALHKSSGHARCRINGRDVFLGPYDSQENRERYAKLVEEWLAESASPLFGQQRDHGRNQPLGDAVIV